MQQSNMDIRVDEKNQTTINDRNEIKHQITKYSYCSFGFTNTPHKDKKDTFNEKT